MLKVGLTGGIACGKSRVMEVLSNAGLATLDLDRVAHEVMAPGGSAHHDVVAAFGPEVLDPSGGIDRKRLGALVFASPEARQRLNSLVHPRVRDAEAEVIRVWRHSGRKVGVVDAALLVETGAHLRFSRLVVVHCPPGMQRVRLMSRNGLDARAAQARLQAQMPIDDKRWFGHLDVDTSGRLEDTDERALQLAAALSDLSERPAPLPPHGDRLLGALAHGASRGPASLHPLQFLNEIAAGSGLDLARLFAELSARGRGSWYERREPLPGPGPQALAPVLAAWCAVDGRDAEYAAAAMGSLARLVGAASRDAAAAVFLALAFRELFCRPEVSGPVSVQTLEIWQRLAERWGGGPVDGALPDLLSAFPSLLAFPDGARRLAAKRGWDGDAAAALAGLLAGAGRKDVADIATALERIAAGSQ